MKTREELEVENTRLRERITKLENSVVELWHVSPARCGVRHLLSYLDMTSDEYGEWASRGRPKI